MRVVASPWLKQCTSHTHSLCPERWAASFPPCECSEFHCLDRHYKRGPQACSFKGFIPPPHHHHLCLYILVDIDMIHMIKLTRPSTLFLHTVSDQRLGSRKAWDEVTPHWRAQHGLYHMSSQCISMINHLASYIEIFPEDYLSYEKCLLTLLIIGWISVLK